MDTVDRDVYYTFIGLKSDVLYLLNVSFKIAG